MPLWPAILEHPISLHVRTGYRRLFSVGEIENNATLQWLFGAMLLFFYATFSQWIDSPLTSTGVRAVCWPYFMQCNSLHFLSLMPYGYTQTTFYMALFGIMLGIVYCMWKRHWTTAHALLLVLWVWKFYASFVLSWGIAGVYDYYHLILTAVLLFAAHKEYFAKIAFVLLYFLSATVKFYPTWILGTYFTSLQLGLPLLPQGLTPFWTESVIVSQVFGCWFLLSQHKILQRIAVVYFTIFHLYSGVLVYYPYPTVTEPALLILFGPLYRHQWPPLRKTAIAGWLLVAILILFQVPSSLIQGDVKITMEGYRFGMWMFDANHQCIAQFNVYYKPDATGLTPYHEESDNAICSTQQCVTLRDTSQVNGQWITTIRVESPRAEIRCSPYTMWQTYISLCASNVERVAYTFDHSINGGPFYRIVDVPDMCGLTYSPFSHNSWIQEPPAAPIVGYPVKNRYF